MTENLQDLLVAAAARWPDAVAVKTSDGKVTYGELNRRADLFAGTLTAGGVRRGDRVVLWSPKSADVIAAMQGTLRIGAVYVPVDPLAPPDRVRRIIDDAGARVLCAPRALAAGEAAFQDVACVDLDSASLGAPTPPTQVRSDSGDLAYLLYTSGSRGVPKGVCISHGNALAFIRWFAEELQAGQQDVFANHAPFSFDLSVLDIYVAMTAGATVAIVPPDMAYTPKLLVEFLHQENITVWYSVPSVLMLMQRDGELASWPAPKELRALLFAGEPFPIPYVRELAGWTTARLLNLYGPTETNVCTYRQVRAADLEREVPVPIGRACSGNRVWARRPDGTVARPGEEGELVVDGPTVFQGYWGRERQEGPYATGDRVRVCGDGSFDYLGRGDDVVKIRGNRIDLGDVATALHGHPGVADVAVVAVGGGLERRLVAFVVRRPEEMFGQVSLRRHLAGHVPPYMIPQDLRFVPELPRTTRGKIATGKLRAQAVEKEGTHGNAP
ncbi:amino acid adenylation domain-containing protein [Actinophytocola glycyrrhizae]|uniref:Amino acid adenylation domain-containing protein n=1 Tax=Actinophytocola glycyrrhizae TaxID=2044873 RepID=A0ABV9RSH1_9PSEU